MQAVAMSIGWLFALLVLSLTSTTAWGVESLSIDLGDLAGADWQAQGLKLQLQFQPGEDLSGALTLNWLHLPAPLARLEGIRAHCDKLRYTTTQIHCRGRLQVAQMLGEPLQGQLELSYDMVSGGLRFTLTELALAGGRWHIQARLQAADWALDVQARAISATAVQGLLQRLGHSFEYQLSGAMQLSAQLAGGGAGLSRIAFELAGEGVEFSNAVGTQASEKLNLQLTGEARLQAERWQIETHAQFNSGALFVDPLYFEFKPDSQARLDLLAAWQPAQQQLQVQSLQLDHAQVLQAEAALQLNLLSQTPLEQLQVTINQANLPAAFDTYAQPWLRDRLGGELKTRGKLLGRFQTQLTGPTSLELALDEVDIEDPRQRFGFQQLSGRIDWGSDEQTRTTELVWQSGSLYRLQLGASRLAVVSQGTRFELREPISIPLLDGQLRIDDLALSNPGEADMQWRFDGMLTPVSMQAVCEALDWPPFDGQLSGMIPAVKYAEGRLEIGGVLLIKAFDGDLTVRNLRLEQPFGRVPRLNADLALDNLDLEALTKTFSFGKITGRLSGYVNKLYMEAWQPVAFDAYFGTPKGDKSRHRISQKAVDNLSSIGGGVGGALSRSFLGVFEEFPYDRLGLSCRLQNGICAMGGVAPAGNGYYIVKGHFLPPRIDVVGYANRVDWHTLIDRLKSVTLDQAPIVK